MSRVSRYKESIDRFIKQRGNNSEILNTNLKDHFNKHLEDSNYDFSILMLTIMNNQQKKNKISFQGYYAATGIEYLHIILRILTNTELKLIDHQLISTLLLLSMKTISQNIDVAKRCVASEEVNKIHFSIAELVADKSGINGIMYEIENLDTTSRKKKKDVIKFLSKREDMANKYENMKLVSRQDIDCIVEKKICSLASLSLNMAWILGNGNASQSKRINRAGKYFGMLYQIANDFESFDKDLDNEVTLNYIINCGFQLAHETFMENKQKFIEETMILDIYTVTIKELLDKIERKVDLVLETTSPEIKSNFSSY